MAGPVADLQYPFPFDEGDHTQDPVFPAVERNGRCDQVIGKSEFVIKQSEEESQDGLHKKIRLTP